jgi:hypothetical protein
MDVRDWLDLSPAPMSAPASPSATQPHRSHPGTAAPSADLPTSSLPPCADLSLVSDGDSKIGAKKHTDDEQSDFQQACIQTTHCDLPAGYALSACKVDETAAATISIQQASESTSATHKPRSSEYTDGLEQPLQKASADDSIATLRTQLEEQQLLTNSLRSQMAEQRSELKLSMASLEERLGKLESAAADVIVMLPPEAREATVDEPWVDADANPDATLDGA